MDQVGEKRPPPYDSRANGAAVESAVKQVRGRLRTTVLCLEKRFGKTPPRHPVMAWMVPHAASIIRHRVRGPDGKTPYERVMMRPWRNELVGFTEKIRTKLRSKEKLTDGGEAYRSSLGLFLRFCSKTGQYITSDVDKDCAVYFRTVARLSDERKWDAVAIETISTTPYHLHATPEQGVTLAESGDPEKLLRDRPGIARRIYLKGADFKAFGFSDGCPKCDHARRYGPGRTTAPHSEQCRQRVMIELMKTPEVLRGLIKR